MSDRNSNKEKKEDDGGDAAPGEKWVAKNWTFFKKSNPNKLPPTLKSRYLAYEEPPKATAEAQGVCKQRLRELHKHNALINKPPTQDELWEKDKHEKLIGQLKAAEARNRIRIMRLRYESNRGQEVNHLISCQPTARKAVRLQALLPSRHEDRSQGDRMDKLRRARVEALLEDNMGLLTGRT